MPATDGVTELKALNTPIKNGDDTYSGTITMQNKGVKVTGATIDVFVAWKQASAAGAPFRAWDKSIKEVMFPLILVNGPLVVSSYEYHNAGNIQYTGLYKWTPATSGFAQTDCDFVNKRSLLFEVEPDSSVTAGKSHFEWFKVTGS